MTRKTWLGPNGGYGEVARDESSFVWNWPHRSFAQDNLEPTGRQATREGTEPIFDFNDYWTETPQQKAWELVAVTLGVDTEEPCFQTEMEKTIAKKLTAATCSLFSVSPERDALISPEPSTVDELLTCALTSGDPIGHLDELAAQAAFTQGE